MTKTILVTGAAKGIGRALALGLADNESTLILLDKDLPRLESIYDQIKARDFHSVLYPMDLTGASPGDYAELASRIEKEYSKLDALIHCAAALPYLSRIDDFEADQWMLQIQVNLNACFFLSQACLPLLKAAHSASLIFTTDSVASQAKAYYGAYAVSKAAIENLMKILALENEGSSLHICAVDPGITNTALRRTIFPAEDTALLKPPENLLPLYQELLNTKNHYGEVVRF